MNRIEERFAQLRRDGKKGFIVYIGAGDPNLDATRELALAFDKAGVDILELGVPFSDPLADGLVNQLAAQRGLESGTTPPKVLETVAAIRRQSQIPIVLYIYFNLIHKRRPGKIHRRRREGRRGRPAGARFAAGGIGQLRGADEKGRPLPHLSRRADDAGRPHGTHRQTRQRIHLLHLARRRDRNADAGRVESRVAGRQNPRAHESAHRRRFRHLESGAGQGRGVGSGRLRGRQRGGESDRRKRKIKRSGQARRQICEIAGRCGEINLSHR